MGVLRAQANERFFIFGFLPFVNPHITMSKVGPPIEVGAGLLPLGHSRPTVGAGELADNGCPSLTAPNSNKG